MRYPAIWGLFAFIWRFVLTGGTGSIFGFLVAREFFDSAMMAPIFIVLSLTIGAAAFIVIVAGLHHWRKTPLQPELIARLTKLLGVFIACQLFLLAVFSSYQSLRGGAS